MEKKISFYFVGKCGSLPCANRTGTFPCDYKITKDYKFYLSFENSICTDYVTEKLFNTMMLPIVPIVLGGADYAKYAPEHSFINIADFENSKQLAQYLLYLDKNDQAYLAYFQVGLKSKFPILFIFSEIPFEIK